MCVCVSMYFLNACLHEDTKLSLILQKTNMANLWSMPDIPVTCYMWPVFSMISDAPGDWLHGFEEPWSYLLLGSIGQRWINSRSRCSAGGFMAYFWDLWKHAGIKFMEHIGIYGLMWLLWYIMIHLIRDKLAVSYPMYPAWFFSGDFTIKNWDLSIFTLW